MLQRPNHHEQDDPIGLRSIGLVEIPRFAQNDVKDSFVAGERAGIALQQRGAAHRSGDAFEAVSLTEYTAVHSKNPDR
jgi:hypothetical protein